MKQYDSEEAEIEYVYRVDTEEGLKRIHDNAFRAKKWPMNHDYPHKVLQEAKSLCPLGQYIYRICFYSSLEHAKDAERSIWVHLGGGRITRVQKQELTILGFKESWDDGFEEGHAYLFWKYDRPFSNANTSLSNSGIPCDRMHLMTDNGWMRLTDGLG